MWHLLFRGALPDAAAAAAFGDEVRRRRTLPPGLHTVLPAIAQRGAPLDVLRTAVSLLAAELGWRPTHDIGADELYDQALGLCAVVPTILAAAYRLRQGQEPVEPRDDLGFAANYLFMLTGSEPSPEHARAIEQYMILTIDHGFNASTFTARVVTSTGADLGAAIVAAIGALSGPLHGGAPSRALDMLDAIGTPERAEAYIRAAVEGGDRIMGFGHRVYKTDDPRSLLLRSVTERLGGPLVEFSQSVERTTVDVLAELKPGRQLYTNVEFYAGVVMHTCGIPREMFTPTFAAGRTIGWSTHVMEQAAHNRLIRPAARYVGAAPAPAGPAPPRPDPGPGLRPAVPPASPGETRLNWSGFNGFGKEQVMAVERPRGTSSRARTLFSFPNPVNEVSARLVAAGVVVMCVLTIALDLRWATIVIAYGFVARVLTGPTLSPLGQFVTRVVTPRLDIAERPVAGPPKRFAQGMGVAFSVTALILTGLGYWTAAEVFLGLLAAAALLESAFGLCLGCKAFAVLMRVGVVPEEVCERCNDIWGTQGAAA